MLLKVDHKRSEDRPTSSTILLTALVAVLLLFSRRPDAFINPQFWAEDGTKWYADAYNLGWCHVLFTPWGGYLQLLQRLTAAMAMNFPLAAAPTVFNVIAILLELLPPIFFFLSPRFSYLAKFRTRAYLSFLCLALPNSSEIHANITGAHWHMGLLAFLLIIAESPKQLRHRLFDLSALILSAITGPFSIFLAPLSLIWWWKYRQAWQLVVALVLGAIIQIVLILVIGARGRSGEMLGTTLGRLLKILSGKVFLAAIIGSHDLGSTRPGWTWYLAVATVVVLLSTGALLYALLKAPLALKMFVAFGFMVLSAALISPLASMNTPQWYLLQVSRSGLRYWFLPMLAFTATLVWMTGRGQPVFARHCSIAVLLLMTIGIVRDWRYPALIDLHFEKYAHSFERVSTGTRFRIPLNPPGWSMELIKRLP